MHTSLWRFHELASLAPPEARPQGLSLEHRAAPRGAVAIFGRAARPNRRDHAHRGALPGAEPPLPNVPETAR